MLNGKEYRDWIGSRMKMGEELLYLSESECRALPITDKEVFDLTERALILYSERKVDMPAKIAIHPLPGTFYHAMPCSIEEMSSAGIKWGMCYPDNRVNFGIKQTSCLLIYNEYLSGVPLAVMDALFITEIRTPCVAFASAKHMAKQNAKTFGMIGCGTQGKEHVRIVNNTLKDVDTIYIYDVYEDMMDALIKQNQNKVSAKIIKAKSIEEVIKSSEVVASAAVITDSPQPEIKDEWVVKGQTFLSSDLHSHFEDVTIKRMDKYTLDSISQHELLSGFNYYPQGLPNIYAEIGEVCAGKKPGRENDDEIIFCNNVGMAVEDMMVARILFDRALEAKAGRFVPL